MVEGMETQDTAFLSRDVKICVRSTRCNNLQLNTQLARHLGTSTAPCGGCIR